MLRNYLSMYHGLRHKVITHIDIEIIGLFHGNYTGMKFIRGMMNKYAYFLHHFEELCDLDFHT